MKWMPIESAPKDGGWVWLFEPGDIPVCGYWREINDPDFNWSGWAYSDILLDEVRPEGPQPTHWMPLPEPPNED